MPSTRVIGGSGGTRVRVTAQGGSSRVLPIVPTEFTADGGMDIAVLDRQGREDLTRLDGPRKKTLSFTITLGRVDWRQSVQSDVDWLQKQRDEGRRIKFSGMPKQFAGWWLIESMPVDVTQMTPGHRISRANLSMSLIAHLDVTGRVQRQPPRRPTPKPKAKSPVYRYHTVVSGDWLSKIAQRYLGNMNRWPEIYRLNKAQIDRRGNPDLIFPGQRFKIPPK